MKRHTAFIAGLLLAAVSLLHHGCATPQYNYQPTATEISFPALEKEVVAQVGEEMVRQGKYIERDAINLAEPIKIGLLAGYVLGAGDYLKTGEDKDSEFYLPAPGPNGAEITKTVITDPWKSVQLMKREPKINVVTVFHAKVGTDAKGVTRVKRMLLTDDSFQQTLIYSGKLGSRIRLGYREFSNNTARPAFNNDVDYDLSESTTIGYKGARIEILEATNQYVRYRVTQNFNRAER